MSASPKALLEKAGAYPVVGVLIRAAVKGQRDAEKDRAASIAFFAFLSLFPLILGLIALGGTILKSEDLQARVFEFIARAIPVSAEFITGSIDSVVRLRGAAGVTSALVLLWSASKMVSALTRGINKALDLKRPYAFYLSKPRSFGLTLVVSLLLFVALALAPTAEILVELEPAFLTGGWRTLFKVLAGQLTGFVITFAIIGILYFLLPYERLAWREILPGLIVATAMIEVGKSLFAFYFDNFSRYDLVYGSIASIIVLLIWLYFCARFVLYGAELISVCRARSTGSGE